MTAMPQMVALFNGVGGGAAALVAASPSTTARAAAGTTRRSRRSSPSRSRRSSAVSFAGSMIAFAKLQELIGGRPITFAAQHLVNAALAGVASCSRSSSAFTDNQPASSSPPPWPWCSASAGAADRRRGHAGRHLAAELVTGLAAATTGFVLDSNMLIVSGTLVGACGTLLTQMMGRAMNRSISNVLFGAFGAVRAAAAASRRRRRATASCARSARPTRP